MYIPPTTLCHEEFRRCKIKPFTIDQEAEFANYLKKVVRSEDWQKLVGEVVSVHVYSSDECMARRYKAERKVERQGWAKGHKRVEDALDSCVLQK